MNIFSNADLQDKYLLERIKSEIDFAEKFSGLHPLHKAEWLLLIERAKKEIADAIKTARIDLLPSAVKKTEKIMSPIGALAKKNTIHCVGHAHIDMNWMWSWSETVSITVDTFIRVPRLMEKYKDFCFSHSQASTYRIIEKCR